MLNNLPSKTFKVLGLLMCYPDREWVDHGDELIHILSEEGMVLGDDLQAITDLVLSLKQDLLGAQEIYVATFDRVRSLSLHLFEHIHGESRDRGQAMVDLVQLYKQNGLWRTMKELPDYLPMFLEYLSFLPRMEAVNNLVEPVHILQAIAKRLSERRSDYASVFNALIKIAGAETLEVEAIKADLSPDFAEMDTLWEDKSIEFLASQPPSGCGVGSASPCASTKAEASCGVKQ